MLADLHAPASAAAPVVTGYAMLFGGLLTLGARLGDRFGHRRFLLYGLALFAAGSLLAATATSVVLLVIARSTQGAAAAASVPAALRLLSAVASDETARRRAPAAWSAAGAAAGASGFLLGGLVTQVAGWRAVFWLNVPLALLTGAGLRALLPADRGEHRHRLDIAGAVQLTTAVMAAVAGGSLAERPERLIAGLRPACSTPPRSSARRSASPRCSGSPRRPPLPAGQSPAHRSAARGRGRGRAESPRWQPILVHPRPGGRPRRGDRAAVGVRANGIARHSLGDAAGPSVTGSESRPKTIEDRRIDRLAGSTAGRIAGKRRTSAG